LEYWGNLAMGFGQMEYWDIEKTILDIEVNKRVFFFLYQHSIIPSTKHKNQASKNPFNFTKL